MLFLKLSEQRPPVIVREAIFLWSRHRFSGRELVQLRSGTSTNHSEGHVCVPSEKTFVGAHESRTWLRPHLPHSSAHSSPLAPSTSPTITWQWVSRTGLRKCPNVEQRPVNLPLKIPPQRVIRSVAGDGEQRSQT